MSDDKGSNGIFEDAVAAKKSKTWEARLKEAREKRAAVLAEAQEQPREKPVLKPSETTYLSQPDETKIEEIVSDRVRSLNLEEQPDRKKPKRRAAIILAALVCGAFLQWAITNIAEIWPTESGAAPANLDASTENLPEIEELLSDRASKTELATSPDQQKTQATEAPTDTVALEAAPVSNPSVVSEPEETVNEAPLDQNVLIEAALTPPTPAESGSGSDGAQTSKPVPPNAAPEPDLSSTPPAIFIPAPLEPTLTPATPAGFKTSPPATVEPQSREPNPLNKGIVSQVSLAAYDPVPQGITISALPSYTEVKPLPPAQSPIDLEVSLFVPSRVSQEASRRAFDLLTQGRATVVATARVGFRVKETQVRFYHPSDAENAAMAADTLGGVARDFTRSGSKTRPGRIEVYLAGSGGGGSRRNSEPEPTDFDNFIARILNELR